MSHKKIIKQARATDREKIQLITFSAHPVAPYPPDQVPLEFCEVDLNIPHKYKVSRKTSCASHQKKFDDTTETWEFYENNSLQGLAKFYELVGEFCFHQVSRDNGAILKVLKDGKPTRS